MTIKCQQKNNSLATIGARIKNSRKAMKLTQAQLAEKLDLSQGFIGHIEAGRNQPTLDQIMRMAIIFDCNMTWLATGEGDVAAPKEISYPTADGLKNADLTGEITEGFVQVPRYEVSASAGHGVVIHSEQIVDHLSFKAEWVHNALGVPVKDLALINVTGDSMEPTLSEGDLILIDMSHRGMKDNAIYVLQLNGSLLVKRLQHKLDGSVVVKSDNLIYDSEIVSGEAIDLLNIIGRVVWCGRRM